MIPLKDDTPRFTTPYITYFLIAANTIVFLFQLTLPQRAQELFVYQFGLTPALVAAPLQPGSHVPLEIAFLPFLTSMFLHAGPWHLIGNMWFLWIFGDNIEDYLGHSRYLMFYLSGGIAAALVHTFFNWGSNTPTVGASGAIAAVMGAYFMLYPSARVLTFIPLFFIFFFWLPAWVFLVYWFVLQFLSGAATSLSTVGRTGGGIAFWAHVGGFIFGLLIIRILPRRTRRYRYGR